MLHETLKNSFSFTHFRPGQEEIIKSIVEGHDTLAIMPTGGGKSLCYQLPAMEMGTLTVIVSPLIALMKDQVDALTARGLSATYINSSLSAEDIRHRMHGVQAGSVKLLYVAPERFKPAYANTSAGGQETFLTWFMKLPIGLFAVDEAHCISQWGHDFRPDYRALADVIGQLPKRPIVAAFTATATPEVKQDIITGLQLRDPHVYVRGFDRPNLIFRAETKMSDHDRGETVLKLARELEGSGIVYALTRKKTHEVAEFLSDNGVRAVAYHAGLESSERTRIQEEFMQNKHRVIVATVAFGMGVDKADIRFVIHAGMPGTLEGYYQEAGRAGRDGESAECILLHSGRDTSLHHFFIRKAREEMEGNSTSPEVIDRVIDTKYRQLRAMMAYAESSDCKRKSILTYFGDPSISKFPRSCNRCDSCLAAEAENDHVRRTDPEMYLLAHGSPEDILQENSISRLLARRPNSASAKAGVLSGATTRMTDTVAETVRLYQANHAPEAIAKIRSLAMSTVCSHLIQWYIAGGAFDISTFVTLDEERLVLEAMSRADDYQHLRPIKDKLPEDFSYEKIKAVIAKIQRVKL